MRSARRPTRVARRPVAHRLRQGLADRVSRSRAGLASLAKRIPRSSGAGLADRFVQSYQALPLLDMSATPVEGLPLLGHH